MKVFLLRVLYKSQKLLPFRNEFPSKVSCIFTDLFNEENLLSLAKTYPNIISQAQYFKFHEKVQNWELNIDSLKTLYVSHEHDIVKFYLDRKVSGPYLFITQLTTAILIFRTLAQLLNNCSHT